MAKSSLKLRYDSNGAINAKREERQLDQRRGRSVRRRRESSCVIFCRTRCRRSW